MIEIQQFVKETKTELLDHIYPFWCKMKDSRGGYYGAVDFNLNIKKDAEKGAILNSRILWFFSTLYRTYHIEEALSYAEHAYRFLTNSFLDNKYGGVYWMVTKDGSPFDDMKHTYCQSFAVYGLAAYYRASGDKQALQLSLELFSIIEEKCTDEYGYLEAFSRDWHPILNDKLSEDGFYAEKTMNTLLHVIEAYTELYLAEKNVAVGSALKKALQIYCDFVYEPQRKALAVFFNRELENTADLYSYGHDIEASWLIDRACEVLDDAELNEKIFAINAELAKQIKVRALKNGAIHNQKCRGTVDETRVWWVQCEGILGFLNAYEKCGELEYLNAAIELWDYIKKHFIDLRPNGEWYWDVDNHGDPISRKNIVEPWKCPYHNGRMCMEVGGYYERLCRKL